MQPTSLSRPISWRFSDTIATSPISGRSALRELVDLGRGRLAAGEDAEVDADLEPRLRGLRRTGNAI